ncbi:unnamed protein product, partial [Gulo gulo]
LCPLSLTCPVFLKVPLSQSLPRSVVLSLFISFPVILPVSVSLSIAVCVAFLCLPESLCLLLPSVSLTSPVLMLVVHALIWPREVSKEVPVAKEGSVESTWRGWDSSGECWRPAHGQPGIEVVAV